MFKTIPFIKPQQTVNDILLEFNKTVDKLYAIVDNQLNIVDHNNQVIADASKNIEAANVEKDRAIRVINNTLISSNKK